MMLYYIYDGTLTDFLTAIYDSYYKRFSGTNSTSGQFHRQLFDK